MPKSSLHVSFSIAVWFNVNIIHLALLSICKNVKENKFLEDCGEFLKCDRSPQGIIP